MNKFLHNIFKQVDLEKLGLSKSFFEQMDRYKNVVEDYRKVSRISPNHTMAFVNWGINLAQEGDMATALEKFEAAARMVPVRPETYTNWGVALAKLRRFEEAIDKFQRAAELIPENPGNYTLWGAALVEQGKLSEAKILYERAIKLNPENAEPYVSWGIALARVGEYREAVQSFQTALSIQSYQPQVYFLWGAVLAELQDYEQAVEKFRTTLRFIPKHAEARYFLSVALNRLGRYQEALPEAQEVLSLKSGKPEVHLNLGDILANLRRYEEAIIQYQQAVSLNPNMAEAYLSFGVSLCKMGRFQEGYANLGKAAALNPNLKDIYRHWGGALIEEQKYAEAIPFLEKAAAENPDETEIILNWALALLKTGESQAAYIKLLDIEKREPFHSSKNFMIQFLLGSYHLHSNQFTAAIPYFKKCLEESPYYEDAVINLSVAYCEEGETMDAIRILRPLLRKSPDSPQINFYYGTALFRHGDVKEAIPRFQKCLDSSEEYPEARLALTEAYMKLDKLTDAEVEIKRFLAADPSSLSALYLLGIIYSRYAEKNNHAAAFYCQALTCFEEILKRQPSHLDALVNHAYMQGHLEGVPALETAFKNILDGPLFKNDEEQAMILYYWGKSLDNLGFSTQAQEKYQLARKRMPAIEKWMKSINI